MEKETWKLVELVNGKVRKIYLMSSLGRIKKVEGEKDGQ